MESPNDINTNQPIGEGMPAPAAPASSRLGVIGIALGVLGLIVYCLPLAIAFVMGLSGNPPAATDTSAIALGLVSNCGALVGIIGGVLGGVSLARNENKTYGVIAIVIGVLLLCTCVGLSATGMLMNS